MPKRFWLCRKRHTKKAMKKRFGTNLFFNILFKNGLPGVGSVISDCSCLSNYYATKVVVYWEVADGTKNVLIPLLDVYANRFHIVDDQVEVRVNEQLCGCSYSSFYLDLRTKEDILARHHFVVSPKHKTWQEEMESLGYEFPDPRPFSEKVLAGKFEDFYDENCVLK